MKTTLLLSTLLGLATCGLAADPAPPAAPAAKPALGAQSGTRRVSFKAKVDGSDDVVIQDGQLHIEHVDWDRPLEISVNGKKWKPAWKDKRTDEFTGFSPALAPFAGAAVMVKQAKGRGETEVREQPTEANGQKLVIRLHDAGNGASDFEVHITW